jgi:hypothetical protein
VRCRERLQPPGKSRLEFIDRAGSSPGLVGNRLDYGEKILGAMGNLAHEKSDMIFRDLPIGYVSDNVN